jgi:hypothetical protein
LDPYDGELQQINAVTSFAPKIHHLKVVLSRYAKYRGKLNPVYYDKFFDPSILIFWADLARLKLQHIHDVTDSWNTYRICDYPDLVSLQLDASRLSRDETTECDFILIAKDPTQAYTMAIDWCSDIAFRIDIVRLKRTFWESLATRRRLIVLG